MNERFQAKRAKYQNHIIETTAGLQSNFAK